MRTIPIHRSGIRINLFMGGDREMVMFSGLLSASLIFALMDKYALIYAIILWSFSLFSLRLMAKADPLMRQVYLRHRGYIEYYSARSTPFRVNLQPWK